MSIDRKRLRGESGMATVEYGVGILCTTAIAGGLLVLVDGDWYADLLVRVFDVSFNRTLADMVSSLW
jgi:hypothetical protein